MAGTKRLSGLFTDSVPRERYCKITRIMCVSDLAARSSCTKNELSEYTILAVLISFAVSVTRNVNRGN